jgi:signal transduction histidine kinase
MLRQSFLIVFALFATLLLFFAGAAWLIRFVITRDQEAELENRLAAIGSTLALATEAREPGLAEELAIAYDPSVAAKLGRQPLAERYLWDGEAFFDALLEQTLQAHGLRSAALVSAGGAALASASGDGSESASLLGLEDSPFLLMDGELIERAIRTGQPAASLLYEYDGVWQKRVYVPWASAPSARSRAADATVPIIAPAVEPVVLLRLEAGANYLERLEDIRRRTLWIFVSGGAVLAGVGFVVWGAMRRLERGARHLAKQDRLRSLGTLASGLAHELRNPLGIMRLSAEELADELRRGRLAKPETLAPVAEEILEEIDRLARLISDILAFARGGEEVGAEGSCDPAEVAGSCVRWLSKSTPSTWRVESNHADPAWQGLEAGIAADALRQVLLNLLRNAAEAMESGKSGRPPAIELRLRESQDGSGMLEILVSDAGPGVPRMAAAAIFEPFYSDKEQGTGLGLAISRKLLTSAGGDLKLMPGAGKLGGATFAIRLPLIAAKKLPLEIAAP